MKTRIIVAVVVILFILELIPGWGSPSSYIRGTLEAFAEKSSNTPTYYITGRNSARSRIHKESGFLTKGVAGCVVSLSDYNRQKAHNYLIQKLIPLEDSPYANCYDKIYSPFCHIIAGQSTFNEPSAIIEDWRPAKRGGYQMAKASYENAKELEEGCRVGWIKKGKSIMLASPRDRSRSHQILTVKNPSIHYRRIDHPHLKIYNFYHFSDPIFDKDTGQFKTVTVHTASYDFTNKARLFAQSFQLDLYNTLQYSETSSVRNYYNSNEKELKQNGHFFISQIYDVRRRSKRKDHDSPYKKNAVDVSASLGKITLTAKDFRYSTEIDDKAYSMFTKPNGYQLIKKKHCDGRITEVEGLSFLFRESGEPLDNSLHWKFEADSQTKQCSITASKITLP